MASSINTNMASLVAQRNLSGSQTALATSVERLSSGMRINRAKDDAAGMAISTELTKQIGTINVAQRNANDAISMVQTADGALGEVSTMLQRMKELSTQGANSALSDAQRKNISNEIVSLRDEINKVAERTTFNGIGLLNGGPREVAGGSGTQIGGVPTAGAAVTAMNVDKAKVGTFEFTNDGDELTLTDEAGNSQMLTVLDMDAGDTQTLNFSSLGVSITLASAGVDPGTGLVAVDAADIADGMTGTLGNVAVEAGTADFDFQVGASGTDTITLTNLTDIQIDGTEGDYNGLATAISAFADGTSTVAEAQTLMSQVDDMILSVANQRADLGAQQNRLDHNIANLMAQSENLQAARSRVMDTDYASETASLTKGQIMQQASAAMLAQANQMPNVILSLLK